MFHAGIQMIWIWQKGMEIFYMMKMAVVSLVFDSIVDVSLHNYHLEFLQS